jgi:CelD/BcsL family acetyltransferase involved in cellulose biosynthesis
MQRCPESLWEELCRADPACTFYQTPAWHRIAARHYRAESIPLLFRFKSRDACLPLLRRRHWGMTRYFSPFGAYTAVICPTPLEPPDLAAISADLKKLPLHLISSPFTPNRVGAGRASLSRIQIIDLNALDPDNPMRDWEEGQRRRVRVAQREGLNVRLGESDADWDRYFELYRISLGRWGSKATTAYPKALFDDIRASLAKSPAMKLWLAEHKGEVGAGYLTFYHQRHVVPWHGAADPRFFQLGAAQSLFLAMIRDALSRGFSVFDLTGSGGISGVESFKSRFGTKALEFESYLNRPGVLGALAAIRDGMSRRPHSPVSTQPDQ